MSNLMQPIASNRGGERRRWYQEQVMHCRYQTTEGITKYGKQTETDRWKTETTDIRYQTGFNQIWEKIKTVTKGWEITSGIKGYRKV